VDKKRVFVLGIDGATFDLILPWVRENRLPNLANLMSNGVWGELQSTIHPDSAQAWSSFMTGKTPSNHGILYFTERAPDSYEFRFVNANSRKSKSLWRIIGETGKKVGVLNVPITYPVESVNGVLISGLGTPGETAPFAYPPELATELRRLFDYTIELYIRDYVRWKKKDFFLRDLIALTRKRFEVASYLWRTYAPDFFMMVSRSTDQVQHYFWRDMDSRSPQHRTDDSDEFKDAILQVYQETDKELGKFLQTLNQETIIFIMSDHGAGGDSNKAFYINKWLAKEGFLVFQKAMPGWKATLSRYTSSLLMKGILIGTKYIPRNYKNKLRGISKLRGMVFSLPGLAGIDWSKTKAFSDEHNGNIWINLEGREPHGTVKPGQEYEELREKIIERLTQLRDPDNGSPLVKTTYKREEIHRGKYAHKAPDIIFLRNEEDYPYVFRSSASYPGNEFYRTISLKEMESDIRPNASHRLNGIFIAAGKEIKKNLHINDLKIIDLAPTILHLFGIPIPDDMDGRVLHEIFTDSFLKNNPPRYSGSKDEAAKDAEVYSSKEAEVIRETLKGLGYIE
jgi:predicted AlkP superfamily phosphohydrolase/phosphomutase